MGNSEPDSTSEWQCIGLTTSDGIDSDSQTLPLRIPPSRCPWGSTAARNILALVLTRAHKAAQAAVQVAQAAALQTAAAAPSPPAAAPVPIVVPQQPTAANGGNSITPAMLNGMMQEQAIMLLQKFSMQVYVPAPNAYAALSSSAAYAAPSSSNAYAAPAPVNGGSSVQPPSGSSGAADGASVSGSGSRNAPQPQFTEESLKVRRDEGPFGYPQRASSSRGRWAVRGGGDAREAARLVLGGVGLGLPHPSKVYAPVLQTPTNAGGKMVMGMGGRADTGAAALRAARRRSRSIAPGAPAPHTDADADAAYLAPGGDRDRDREEFESMCDLNGTLASLDLDCARERERELGVGDRSRAR
ncbi:hypothetical protein C8R44DRAFT_873440 [Mycena epipterygia]|nr:hypothetical protein C8R44DRAFT_873440 [Mycena epipterygia]